MVIQTRCFPKRVKIDQLKMDRVLEAFAYFDIMLLNVGNTSTFQRANVRFSVALTFVSDSLYSKVAEWEIREYYTNNDHQVITWTHRNDPTK